MELQDHSQETRSELTDEIIRFCRVVSAVERDAICCGDVTLQQCVALQALLDGPMTNSGLASLVGASVSATTRLISGLMKRGFVTRGADPADRRRVVLALTDAGVQRAGELRGTTEGVVDELLARIPADQVESLRVAFTILREAAEEGFGPGCC